MKALGKTEGINPSGVEMIHTPILLENLRDDETIKYYSTYFLALSTLKDVAREIISTNKITPDNLSRLEDVCFDREDDLNYDIDYLIILIKEYLWYEYALDNWVALQIADNTGLYETIAVHAKRVYDFIINKCNNTLINR